MTTTSGSTTRTSNTNACCQSCYPAFPSTVNITNTTIELGDKPALIRSEPLTWAPGQCNLSDLDNSPMTHASLDLYINGVLQQLNVDYTIVNKTIVLSAATCAVMRAEYINIANYWTIDDSTTPSGTFVEPGMSVSWKGDITLVPDGWLLEDGTAYNQADYPKLFEKIGHDYALNAGDETALEAAGQFRLDDTLDTHQDQVGPVTVQLPSIIKT